SRSAAATETTATAAAETTAAAEAAAAEAPATAAQHAAEQHAAAETAAPAPEAHQHHHEDPEQHRNQRKAPGTLALLGLGRTDAHGLSLGRLHQRLERLKHAGFEVPFAKLGTQLVADHAGRDGVRDRSFQP